MYSVVVVLFGFIVHIKYFKLHIFSLYVNLKLIYFVFGDFDWIFVEAIVMRMTMGDKWFIPPDTLNRFIPSGGINSFIPPDSLRTDTLFRDTGTKSVKKRKRKDRRQIKHSRKNREKTSTNKRKNQIIRLFILFNKVSTN